MKKQGFRIVGISIAIIVTLAIMGASAYAFWQQNRELTQSQNEVAKLQEASIDHLFYKFKIDKNAPGDGVYRNAELSFTAPMTWKTQKVYQGGNIYSYFTYPGANGQSFARELFYFRVAQLKNTTIRNPEMPSQLSVFDVTNWAHQEPHLPPNADEDTRRGATLGFNSKSLAQKQAYLKFLQGFQDGHELNKTERDQILLPTVPAAHVAGIPVPYAKAIATSQGKGVIYADMIEQQPTYSPMLVVNVVQNASPRTIFIAAEIWTDDESSQKLKTTDTFDEEGTDAAIERYREADFDPTFKTAIDEVTSVIKTIRIDLK